MYFNNILWILYCKKYNRMTDRNIEHNEFHASEGICPQKHLCKFACMSPYRRNQSWGSIIYN